MKKTILITILGLFFSILLTAQQNSENYYYYKGEKIFLTEKADKLLIKLSRNADKQKLLSIVQADEYVQLNDGVEALSDFVILEAKNSTTISFTTLKKYRENPDIVSAQLMLDYHGALQGLIDEFVVKLQPATSFEQLQDLAAEYACVIVEENQFVKRQYLLSVAKTSVFNAMQMANVFYETGLFEFTVPSFFIMNVFSSNDTYFNQQWALNNTGQNGGIPGIDIKAEQAWTITEGNASIKVAIVDTGVDLTHPDLSANLLPGYDAFGDNPAGAPVSSTDNHGTACAGIIGAIKDNGTGISGVAPNCKIIPIHPRWYIIDWLANSINWAWHNGADVISNSWNPISSDNILLTNAIDSAVIYGREGKGCVVVFSSGNDNSSTVNYPANLPNVIAVGAIDRCGVRSGRIDIVPNSCDPWCVGCQPGSAYGTALDVVAPGTNVPTTDRQGNDGYNNSTTTTDYTDKDYTAFFGGTSAACPYVAGVAALVLSVNPNLTAQQVRDIIESTAQKVRPDLYEYKDTLGRPNGTWHREMGYGLVNAYAAVRAACATIPVVNFINQTVTTNTTVNGCDINIQNVNIQNGAKLTVEAMGNINVQNVKVTNGAKLILDAGGEVNIIGDFDVELGSEFEIR